MKLRDVCNLLGVEYHEPYSRQDVFGPITTPPCAVFTDFKESQAFQSLCSKEGFHVSIDCLETRTCNEESVYRNILNGRNFVIYCY